MSVSSWIFGQGGAHTLTLPSFRLTSNILPGWLVTLFICACSVEPCLCGSWEAWFSIAFASAGNTASVLLTHCWPPLQYSFAYHFGTFALAQPRGFWSHYVDSSWDVWLMPLVHEFWCASSLPSVHTGCLATDILYFFGGLADALLH